MKFAVTNYDHGIGTDDFSSRDEVVAYCEMFCGDSCDNIDSQSVLNSDHCDRNSFNYFISIKDSSESELQTKDIFESRKESDPTYSDAEIEWLIS